MDETRPVGMLHGIRVLDLTMYQQGPAATVVLGALGAEVIKIEEPGVGDPGRKSSPLYRPRDGHNLYFECMNLNKKSMTLDLKKEKGKEILSRLVQESDVFVHNFRKGVPERLGADYDTLRRLNLKLVYAAASGYGPEGPDSERPAFDPVGLARSGFMTAVGEPGMPPLLIMGGVADRIGATILAMAILGALVARERQGIGQRVETSLFGSMLWAQALPISQALTVGQQFIKNQRAKTGNPLFNYYQCKDGQWLMLTLGQSEGHWPTLCDVLGRADMTDDERFGSPAKRAQNCDELIRILDKLFASKDRAEWIRSLGEHKDLIFAPVNNYGDLAGDTQAKANRYVIDVPIPGQEAYHTVGIPWFASETPWEMRSAPKLGQDTEEVLLSIGKYSREQIAQFRRESVI